MRINALALTLLFVGYLLTTGTEIITTPEAKIIFRYASLFLLFANIILDRSVPLKYVFALLFLFSLLLASQSSVGQNIVFLALISASLSKLRAKEIAIAFLIPTTTVVAIHILMLNAGLLAVQTTEFSGRLRSTLGFTNPNQASAIYLSFALISIVAHIVFKTRTTLILTFAAFGSAIYVLHQTDTRTATAALFLILFFQIIGAILNRYRHYRGLLRLITAMSPWLGAAATFYLTTMAGSALNISLSLRPYFFSQFVSGISTSDFLIGWRPINDAGVDNMYLMVFSAIGAIGASFTFLSISTRALRLSAEVLPIVLVMLTVSCFESFLLRPEIPISPLFWHLIYSRTFINRSSLHHQRVNQ